MGKSTLWACMLRPLLGKGNPNGDNDLVWKVEQGQSHVNHRLARRC